LQEPADRHVGDRVEPVDDARAELVEDARVEPVDGARIASSL
jgi:hypothetical protein